MHLALPVILAALLAGAGVYGVLARRNAVLVLVGVELLLNAAALLLVTFDAAYADQLHSGQVLTLFVITVAAAEVGVALAVVLLLFRRRGDVDLRAARALGERNDVARNDLARNGVARNDLARNGVAREDAPADSALKGAP